MTAVAAPICRCLALAFLLLLPGAVLAQAGGHWQYAGTMTWPFKPNPGDRNVRASQNITQQGIAYTYEAYSVGLGRWTTDTVNATWGLVDAVTGASVLPVTGREALQAKQRIKGWIQADFQCQQYSSTWARIYLGEPPIEAPSGWKNAQELYPQWGYRSDPVVQVTTACNRSERGTGEFVIPDGPLSGKQPLTIRIVAGIQGSAAVEYRYHWVAAGSAPPPAPPAPGSGAGTGGASAGGQAGGPAGGGGGAGGGAPGGGGAGCPTILSARHWYMHQRIGRETWNWTLTHRESSNVLDAEAHNNQNGANSRHVFEIREVAGNRIQLYRSDAGWYRGTFAPDCQSIVGTTSFGGADEGWTITLTPPTVPATAAPPPTGGAPTTRPPTGRTTSTAPPTVPAPGATAAPAPLGGDWVGEWSNSLGERGSDTIMLVESADGRLSGTWSGTIPVTGMRLGADRVELHGATARRSYRITGRLQNGILRLDYDVTRLDAAGTYTGHSSFSRR